MRRCGPRVAFSLVELIVVIGLIAILIAFLLPALSMARQNAVSVQCQSQLRQIGQALLMYANDNDGWMYPASRGAVPGRPTSEYWPCFVFKPPVWNPPILICPADHEPAIEHSYVLNYHLKHKWIRYHTKDLGGLSPSDVIVMGEKRSEAIEYYMDQPDYDNIVEKYRHGLRLKSNYVYLDLHVDNRGPTLRTVGADPWDIDVENKEDPVPVLP